MIRKKKKDRIKAKKIFFIYFMRLIIKNLVKFHKYLKENHLFVFKRSGASNFAFVNKVLLSVVLLRKGTR